MKYLKIYEDFVNEPKIEDYDLFYFLEELIEEYNIRIDNSNIHYSEDAGFPSFRFDFLMYDFLKFCPQTLYLSIAYDSKNPEDDENLLSEFGELEQAIVKLVERVELLNGRIYIENRRDAYILIYISVNTFEMFKK